MSEQKVWVEKMPETCDECPCHSITEDRCVLLRKQAIEPFLQSCPLHSIKDYKKELVNEVCEKIYKRMESLSHKCIEFRKKDDYSYAWFNIEMFKEILEEIQKEFEK